MRERVKDRRNEVKEKSQSESEENHEVGRGGINKKESDKEEPGFYAKWE